MMGAGSPGRHDPLESATAGEAGAARTSALSQLPVIDSPLVAELQQKAVATQSRIRFTLRHPTGSSFQLIPPGRFLFGAASEDRLARQHERPQRVVSVIHPFWAAVFPITNAQVRLFCQDSHPEAAQLAADNGFCWKARRPTAVADVPAVGLSAIDAEAICRWLSRTDGRSYRLPTEVEWEYLARAGQITPSPASPLPGSRPGPIMQGQGWVNAWGIWDCLGNVTEWTASGYGELTSKAPFQAATPLTNHTRAVRGASWREGAGGLRYSRRESMAATVRGETIGMRVVCDVDTIRDSV